MTFRFYINSLFIAAAVVSIPISGQEIGLKKQILDNPENLPAPVHPLPSKRQMKWQETEFYGFFHYGMNTYTDKEWGNGGEPESLFKPTAVPNPRQWLEAVKAAGMKGGIAVVKHHDGFCLWPTSTTSHNVGNCDTENARKTNIPRDFANAARDLDMKYGFYVSPWDRNSAYWGDGTSRYTNDVFIKQCEELANYGDDQFEMWFDGATGDNGYYGGKNEKRSIDPETYYDMPNLRDKIHKICPNIVMWGLGGEARWIGNESGWSGETCWSMGTGEVGDENGWKWNAGESDAKATSAGWFWHADEQVKSLDELWKIYLETVGRNATLILNFPPNQAGLLPDASVERLKEFGDVLKQRLGNDIAPMANVMTSVQRCNGKTRTYSGKNLIDGDKETFWAAPDSVIESTITLEWKKPQNIHYVELMEYIPLGQRIKQFKVEYSTDGVNFTPVTGVKTTTVGYKRIIPLNGSTEVYGPGFDCRKIRITINDAKACPTLHTVGVY